MSQFQTQSQQGIVYEKCKNPDCVVPQCGYKTCSWSILTQTCTTCHQVFSSIKERATHEAICKRCTGVFHSEDNHECFDAATNRELGPDPDHFCTYCDQSFSTQEQYYSHKAECSEEYGMQLMMQDHYEDEDGWREYEYEEEEERMEDFRQQAISESVCRRCQRYYHVCRCNK